MNGTYKSERNCFQGAITPCSPGCPFLNEDVRKGNCWSVFFESIWEREIKPLAKLLEEKAKYQTKLEAISLPTLTEAQHRQLRRTREEINTILGFLKATDNYRLSILEEYVRLGHEVQRLDAENHWLRERLQKEEADLEFVASILSRPPLNLSSECTP